MASQQKKEFHPVLSKCALAILVAVSSGLVFSADKPMPTITVTSDAIDDEPDDTENVDKAEFNSVAPASNDAARLLGNVPGVSLNGAGAVSSLPAIHGLADDRLRIKIDGMDLISSCPNHMNPPLSYAATTSLEQLQVYSGVSPVSVGGDSIGGTIIAETTQVEFSESDGARVSKSEIGAFYRSNNNAFSTNLSTGLASRTASLRYEGSWSKADNYSAADDFKTSTATGRPGHTLPLDEVGSTAYEMQTHSIAIGLKSGADQFDIKLGYQDMPEQLFPNQRMDMLGNEQKSLNLNWSHQVDWGELNVRAYHETVDHYMNFGADKKFWYGAGSNVAGMPMYSEGTTSGLSVKGEYDLSEKDLLRFGVEYLRYRLDDYWPAVANSMMMGPNTFLNINNGQRDRLAVFTEWEAQQNQDLMTLLGIRVEQVTTNADDVHGYANTNMMGSNQLIDSTAFNALDHKQTDYNIDLTALTRFAYNDNLDISLGVSRKVRSPNLYERYTWSNWTMASVMNNTAGDGNGYVGDVNLKPEKAHTLSATFDFHAADNNWAFAATPYYTHVTDYIDAIAAPGATVAWAQDTFNVLQYANQSARIYGLDLSGHLSLGSNSFGDWGLTGLISYTNGENRDTGDDLYNIMPLNGKFTVTNSYGGWASQLEWIVVDEKDDVSDIRNEVTTDGYGLFNLRTSRSWNGLQLDLGIENIFDKFYYLPTGGTYTGQGTTMTFRPADMPWGIAVPGMGRSVYAGIKYEF
ncbi:MAG: TonB-dependent receptor plug domain-containing protein [Chromatiales bacterium]|jgi:iron complex outermembrane receptor protein